MSSQSTDELLIQICENLSSLNLVLPAILQGFYILALEKLYCMRLICNLWTSEKKQLWLKIIANYRVLGSKTELLSSLVLGIIFKSWWEIAYLVKHSHLISLQVMWGNTFLIRTLILLKVFLRSFFHTELPSYVNKQKDLLAILKQAALEIMRDISMDAVQV